MKRGRPRRHGGEPHRGLRRHRFDGFERGLRPRLRFTPATSAPSVAAMFAFTLAAVGAAVTSNIICDNGRMQLLDRGRGLAKLGEVGIVSRIMRSTRPQSSASAARGTPRAPRPARPPTLGACGGGQTAPATKTKSAADLTRVTYQSRRAEVDLVDAVGGAVTLKPEAFHAEVIGSRWSCPAAGDIVLIRTLDDVRLLDRLGIRPAELVRRARSAACPSHHRRGARAPRVHRGRVHHGARHFIDRMCGGGFGRGACGSGDFLVLAVRAGCLATKVIERLRPADVAL